MHVVHVFVEVQPDRAQDFVNATLENARESIKEPGIMRFDVLQDWDNPNRFVLNEVYRTSQDPARHKETPHYKRWKDAVADMMAEPRAKRVFTNVFPSDVDWD
jgi:(4S)-4-hydroxy-5-phosphonooxypentane-2,3-dione isomerase